MKILIFGTTPPCAKCKRAEEIARQVAERVGGVEVEKHDALSAEGDRYGIMMTPTTVVGDTVVAVGKLPDPEKLERMVRKAKEE